MVKKGFKKSMVQAGKLLKKTPFKWVVGFVGTFAAVALAWMLAVANLNFPSGLILTLLFILGTAFVSLVIQVSALGVGEILERLFGQKVKITSSRIEFDYRSTYPKDNKQQFYLEVQNNEFWHTAKEVNLIWGQLAVSPGVPNDVIRRFEDWNNLQKRKEHGYLEWLGESQRHTKIGRNRSKDALLFELDAETNQFCILSLNRKPFYFPVGSYKFFLHAHAKIPKRYSNFDVYVDVEYDNENGFEIKGVGRE